MLHMGFVSLISGIGALIALIVALSPIGVFLLKVLRKEEELERQHEIIEEDLEELKRENVFDPNPEIKDEEVFEENIASLADQLFESLKEKHGFEVTTYKEMVEKLKSTEKGDRSLREELVNFFKTTIKLEYSDEELTQEEKRNVKKTARDLIKRTGERP